MRLGFFKKKISLGFFCKEIRRTALLNKTEFLWEDTDVPNKFRLIVFLILGSDQYLIIDTERNIYVRTMLLFILIILNWDKEKNNKHKMLSM